MDSSSQLLVSESPLQVLPTLAIAVGLNEAIVLQQMQYWLMRSKTEDGGFRWIYNTVAEWQEQFPFWSPDTIKRTLKSLRERGLIVARYKNESSWDRTLWYTIDYEKLDSCMDATCTNALGQSAPMHDGNLPQSIGADCPDPLGQSAPMFIQETTQETTQETSTDTDSARISEQPLSSSSSAAIPSGSRSQPRAPETVPKCDLVYDRVRRVYENNFGLVTPLLSERIKEALRDYSEEWVSMAMDKAVSAEKRRWGYVEGILKNWAREGLNGQPRKTTGSHRAGDTSSGGTDSGKPWANYQSAEFDAEFAAELNAD